MSPGMIGTCGAVVFFVIVIGIRLILDERIVLRSGLRHRVTAHWLETGHTIHYGPIPMKYEGDWLVKSDFPRQIGLAGVVDDWLIFTLQRLSIIRRKPLPGTLLKIPVDRIRWIRQTKWPGNSYYDDIELQYLARKACFIACEMEPQWQIPMFAGGGDRLVAALCRLNPSIVTTVTEIFPPTEALQFTQDIYGVWHQGDTVQLYVILDRLLVNAYTLIMLDHITKLSLVPFIDAVIVEITILRIDYKLPDDPHP